MSDQERTAVRGWIAAHETLCIEDLAEHLQRVYAIKHQSKQSLYSLLDEAGMSWHKTEKRNPKCDSRQVLAWREEIKENYWRNNLKSSKEKYLCCSKTNVICCGATRSGLRVGERGAAIKFLIEN